MIEAADGYILMQRKIDYSGKEEVLLAIDDIKKHQDMKSTGNVMYSNGGENGEIKAIGQDINIIQPMEGTYPDTDKLWPKGRTKLKIGIGRSVLRKVLLCLDKSEEGITFTFYGAEKPIKIEAANGDIKGLVMPMILPKKEVTPKKPVVLASTERIN